jgi:hypothetical protein
MVQQSGQLAVEPRECTVGSGQALLAALAAAETAAGSGPAIARTKATLAAPAAAEAAAGSRPTIARAQATLAAPAAAEAAARACTGAKASAAFTEAVNSMTEADRAAGRSATRRLAGVSDHLSAPGDWCAGCDRRANDPTRADASEAATPDDSRADRRQPVDLVPAAGSAATARDDAGGAASLVEQAVAASVTGSRASTMTNPTAAEAALA